MCDCCVSPVIQCFPGAGECLCESVPARYTMRMTGFDPRQACIRSFFGAPVAVYHGCLPVVENNAYVLHVGISSLLFVVKMAAYNTVDAPFYNQHEHFQKIITSTTTPKRHQKHRRLMRSSSAFQLRHPDACPSCVVASCAFGLVQPV
jgi:hypothetical protein